MGFGGAAAHLFVREGAKVVLTDIRDELGERAAAALRVEGHDARYMHLDVTSEQNWAQVVDAVMVAHGRLDILFNNAGVSIPAKVEDATVEIWDRELGVHAKGVFLGTRTAIPAMRKGGGGSIINTSSVMGLVGSPTSPAYSAAKGALPIFTKSARHAPGAARSHADGAARHRRGYRQWRAVPGIRRIILGHRLGTGDRWWHDGAVSAHRSTARPHTAGGRRGAVDITPPLPASPPTEPHS